MNFESDNFFNNFEVGNKLGHGHYAEVKHCIKKNDMSEYAAKFIRRRQLLDEKHIGMNMGEIEREANILKMLNHQNIIKLIYCYDLGKNIVLVLELVSGGELFDHISDSEKLSEEEASEFIEQIVLGLHHMHERNIVHLDLKPENVMIENLLERKIKLIDFGLAREIKNKNTIIEMQGTAEFLAPEVIEYNPISYATDMWAIGVITYIMLTGVSPFSGDDQISTFQNIVNCRLEFDEEICSEVSEMAKSFINSLLILDARKRATASACLVHPWIKPMEQSIMFRRRSSIISRDKLQSLKHFVVCPSSPSSEETTPHSIRKCLNNEEYLENVQESPSDSDSDKCSPLKTNTIMKEVKLESFDDTLSELFSELGNKIKIPIENNGNDKSIKNLEEDNDLDNLQIEINKNEISVTHSKQSPNNSDSFNELELNLSEGSTQNGEYNNVHKPSNNNQKFNNAISNSVRRFSSKIESITSFFDTKHKNNPPKNRGSLKNLFNINNDPQLLNSQLSSASSSRRSPNFVKEPMFNMIPTSASVATSPTILRKNMFFNRYISALDTKKK